MIQITGGKHEASDYKFELFQESYFLNFRLFL